MRNKRTAARIEAALARQGIRSAESPVARIERVHSLVDRRMSGERNWTLKEIAEREHIDYVTIYRALKGKPGWFPYGRTGRTIRVTDTLYRAWLTSIALHMSLDAYLTLPEAV